MKTGFLLPYIFKKIGWFFLSIGIIFSVVFLFYESEPIFFDCTVFSVWTKELRIGSSKNSTYFNFLKNNIFDELICLLLIVGGVFIAFSKQKLEDEFISKIRLESLLWATYINYAVLIFALIFVYEIAFFWVLIFNMFTLIGFFIIRFNWALKRYFR